MTILNLMLGTGRGGIEQAALDYAEALALAQIPSLTLLSPESWIEPAMVATSVAHETLVNRGRIDLFAPSRLRAIARRTYATAIICHGNRALYLALRAFEHRPDAIKIIAVSHNYSTRRFNRADLCFAITNHLANHLAAQGCTHIVPMPNTVRLPPIRARGSFRTPPVIGTMGRFVVKKNFKTFIEALAILKANGIAFHAILGGEGEDAEFLKNLIVHHDLQNHITCPGWVKDKHAFFDAIDVFALSSNDEAFGLVIIEAMSEGLPIVSTDANGPREIIHHREDGLVIAKRNPKALAEALEEILQNPAQAALFGEAGRKRVAQQYSMQAMAERLQIALKPYID